MSNHDLIRNAMLPTLCCLAAFAASAADAQAPPAAPAAAAPSAKAGSEAAGEPDMNALADQALAQLSGRLKLTNDQAGRIRPLLADHLGQVRQIFKDHGDPSGVSFPALIQAFSAQRKRFQASLAPILTPDQSKEMEVIRKEVDKSLKDTICNERLAILKDRLSLSGDQEARLRPILSEDFEKKREIVAMMTAPTGGPAVRRTAHPEIEAIQKETEARLRGVLNADQMKAYEAYRDELRAGAQQSG